MKAPISHELKITLIVLMIAAILQALAIFTFLGVDKIVNYELHKYGLHFDSAWANFYQNYSSLFLISLAISIILIVLSIAAVLRFIRNKHASLALAEYVIPLAIMGINIFSIFNFTRITHLIHADLYDYGLQFSFEWASPLLTYTITLLTLIALASATMITTPFLIYFSAREVITAKSLKNRTRSTQIQTAELTSFILITSGTTALLTAIFFNSSILAFIGIGLLFWGILFTYIRKEEYTKSTIVDTVAFQQIDTINQIFKELNFQGTPIYLPPKYFTNPETQKVYIPKKQETELPTPKQIQNQESQIFIENPAGILVTSPGSELVKLFEKTLATNLTRVDLQYLQQNMPKTLVEDLEIVQNFEMETDNNQIYVKIEYFADNMRKKEEEEPRSALDSVLSSAIACALAKATGQPITLVKKEISNNGKNEIVEYQIITEEGQRQP